MSSLDRHPSEVICPGCGFHNRPSFRVCHGCAAPLNLRKHKKPVPRSKVALLPLRHIPFGRIGVLGYQALLLILVAFLAILTRTRPESTPANAVIPVEPAAIATVAKSLTRMTIEPALRELAVTIDPVAIATVSNPLTPTTSTRLLQPPPNGVYTPPMTLSTRSGANVLVPSVGREGSLSAVSLAPAQAAATQPSFSEVITYSVQRGDTLFAVARKFGLMPHTIYWSNLETVAHNPDRLNVGTVLNILPVDGVYHIVSDGETVADLVEKYDVKSTVLYNDWNDLVKGQSLSAGMALVIPSGKGGSAPWPLDETSTGGDESSEASIEAALCGAELSGVPGRRRFDWPTDERRILGWYFRDTYNPSHAGIDIDLKTGDPVRAADGGIISFGGWWVHGGYGNLVVVDHLNGWETWYAHLSRVNVVCGQQIRAGDIIGLGGSTGWSTGPHLHLEMRLAGVPQNPLSYLP